MKKVINAQDAEKKAKSAFDADKGKKLNKVFVTCDGQCFADEGIANAHASSLKHEGYDAEERAKILPFERKDLESKKPEKEVK